MNRILILITLLLVAQQVSAGFDDGSYLYSHIQKCTESENTEHVSYYSCGLSSGYITGVSDAYANTTQWPKCIPNGISSKQLKSVVEQWFKGHPERWHEEAAWLVLAAMSDAWPCPFRKG